MSFFPVRLFALSLIATVFHAMAAEAIVSGAPVECAAPATHEATPSPETGEDLDQLMRDLLGWIGRNTDYDVSGSLADLPSVGFCTSGDWVDYGSTTVLVDDELRGLYDWPNRRILLVIPWERSNPRNVAVLLHELVHHVQLMNRTWECVQAPEWEAHELQEKWLAERGLNAGFNWLRIYLLSRCPRDIHP